MLKICQNKNKYYKRSAVEPFHECIACETSAYAWAQDWGQAQGLPVAQQVMQGHMNHQPNPWLNAILVPMHVPDPVLPSQPLPKQYPHAADPQKTWPDNCHSISIEERPEEMGSEPESESETSSELESVPESKSESDPELASGGAPCAVHALCEK